jgi:hypothetical protein
MKIVHCEEIKYILDVSIQPGQAVWLQGHGADHMRDSWVMPDTVLCLRLALDSVAGPVPWFHILHCFIYHA